MSAAEGPRLLRPARWPSRSPSFLASISPLPRSPARRSRRRVGRPRARAGVAPQPLLEDRESAEPGSIGRAGAAARRPHTASGSTGPLFTISASPSRASARRKRSRSSPGGQAAASAAPTPCRKESSLVFSTSSSFADHAQLVQRVVEQVDERRVRLAGARALAPGEDLRRGVRLRCAPTKISTESVTISGGTRSARYISISSSASRSSGAVCFERRGRRAEVLRRRLVVRREGRFSRRHLAAEPRDAQRVQHLARVAVARRRRLGERAHHHRHDPRRQLGHQLAERLRVAVHHGEQHAGHRRARERPAPREQLVEDARPARTRRSARRPARRAPARATCSSACPSPCPLRVMSDCPRRARPKSMILTCPFGRMWMLAGLQVAVDDSLRVGEGEPVADLLHDRRASRSRLRRRARRDGLLEVVALEQLHGHVDLALLLAEVVDGDDVRMVEARGGLRLALEALAQVLVGASAGPSMVLMATTRSRTGSWALNTSPMAPWPIFPTILYLPIWRSSMRGRDDPTTRVSGPPAGAVHARDAFWRISELHSRSVVPLSSLKRNHSGRRIPWQSPTAA